MKIEMQGLEKWFDDMLFKIEKCTLESGHIHGIIGHNGVGKTTLLRMISGVDKAYNGRILYNGKAFDEKLSETISFMAQKPYMLSRSVQDNIVYPLKLRHVGKEIQNELTQIWLRNLGIETISTRKATVLSGGERQKVSLARGLVYSPDLVLLDEPTANIDPDTVEVLERVLLDYRNRTGATILLITHDLSQAIRLCDDLFVLDKQGLKAVGKEEIVKRVMDLQKPEKFLDLDYMALGV